MSDQTKTRAKCPGCGTERQTRVPGTPCRDCKRYKPKVPPADVQFILAEAQTIRAADEARHQRKESQREPTKQSAGRVRAEAAAPGAGAQHRPA